MAFATEMIIKASLFGKKVTEVPIVLCRDVSKSHKPHLKTFRDGWRALCLSDMLAALALCSSWIAFDRAWRNCLCAPFAPCFLFGAKLDTHTLLFSSLAILCGFNSIWFANSCDKFFAATEGVLPDDPLLNRLAKLIDSEKKV